MYARFEKKQNAMEIRVPKEKEEGTKAIKRRYLANDLSASAHEYH